MQDHRPNGRRRLGSGEAVPGVLAKLTATPPRFGMGRAATASTIALLALRLLARKKSLAR